MARTGAVFALLTGVLVLSACDKGADTDGGENQESATAATSKTEAEGKAEEAKAAEKSDKTPVAEKVRVVALSGGITESVYALGRGADVVGVDASSNYPADTKKVPHFNYHRKLSTEPILAQKPTLVLASKESGPPAVLDQLRAAGVKVEVFDEPTDFESAKKRIEAIGKALGADKEAKEVTSKMDADLKAIKAVENGPKVLGLYARGPKTLMVAGKATVLESMISLAGGKSVPAGFDGFKPLTPEVVVGAEPDVLVISTHGLQSLGGPDGLSKVPALAATPAVKNKRVIDVDDAVLLSFGPRSAEAVKSIATGLSAEK